MMRSQAKPRSFAITRGVLPALALVVAAGWSTAHAQEPTRPTVRVSPVILVEPEVETALPIEILAGGQIPPQTFLRIRGLPSSARLSDGHVVTPGVWAVPLSALGSLRLMAPLSGSGRTELSLSLIAVDGGVISESRSSLVVAPAWLLGQQSQRQEPPRAPLAQPPAAAAPPPPPKAGVARVQPTTTAEPVQPPVQIQTPLAATPPPPAPTPPAVVAALPPADPAPAPALRAQPRVEPPPPAPPAVQPPPSVKAVPPPAAKAPPPPAPKGPPVLTAEERARAETLVQRGEGFLSQGNVAAARQFFRRAADLGLAQAALRLGTTYDPTEMANLRAAGLTSDPKEARFWYERARELGAGDVSARLSRLPGN